MNVLLIFLCFLILLFIIIFIIQNIKIRKLSTKPKNKVHFYVARDKNTLLYLYLGKPERAYYAFRSCENGYCFVDVSVFRKFGLNTNYFKDLKWEDEPIEVFINMED